jgi:hypothetical protein
MAKSILNRKYINCISGNSKDAGSSQYVRWTVSAVISKCGGQHVGGQYMRWTVCAVVGTCDGKYVGGQYMRWSVRAVNTMCGGQ